MTSNRPANKPQTNIRDFSSNRSMIGAGVTLAVLFAVVFAIGMTIGYQSRHVDVATLASDTKSAPRL